MSTETKSKSKKATTTNVGKAKVSAYKVNVLSTNKALRTECKTLGGAIKLLHFFRDDINLSTQYKNIIKGIMKHDDIYQDFKSHCRRSKKGNYCAFFVLQAIHKSLKPKVKTKVKAKAKVEASKPQRKLTPIAKKTVKDLRGIAKSNEIKGYSKMSKAQLITALTTK